MVLEDQEQKQIQLMERQCALVKWLLIQLIYPVKVATLQIHKIRARIMDRKYCFRILKVLAAIFQFQEMEVQEEKMIQALS